jgi:hypothetical protein
VITCNRCGTVNAAGMLNCQVCGTPLASKIENELSARGQNQPVLPAWLETLRAGDRPAAPANTYIEPGFSAADLLDEGTLPSWMRSGRVDQQESVSSMQGAADTFTGNPYVQNNFSQSGAQPALRPSAQPGPNTGDEGLPPRAIAANSLIDEKSLPSWMQKESKNASQEQPNNISAASLLQPDALPEWMRSISAQQEAPARTDSQRFAAFGPPSPLAPSPMQPPAKPETPTRVPQQGLNAGDLIDPQALPTWMSQENNKGNIPSQSAQSGVPASSLLDSDALPPWLRQGGQNQTRMSDNPAAANPPQRLSSGANYWPPAPSHIQPSAQGQTGSISASSFIDANALPEWMRSANGSGQQTGAPGPGHAGAYGNPQPRVDNMRVPSRPRNELNPTDNSEMAANVFASMLGVASSSPQYPGQPGSSPLPPQAQQGGAYAPPPQMPQGGQSFSAPNGMNSGIYNQIPATPPVNAAQSSPVSPGYGSTGGYQSGSYQGNLSGAYPAGMPQNVNPYGNPASPMSQNVNPYGNPAGGPTAYAGGAAGAGPIFPSMPDVGEQKSAKPAKRGIFEALRDLLFR